MISNKLKKIYRSVYTFWYFLRILAAMSTKKEQTAHFIIETVAPIFIKHGFAGTSMKQLTDATGMTKGAIYGNFENKEDLAVKTFNYLVRSALWPVGDYMNQQPTAELKLKALARFYRKKYPRYMEKMGGCPLMSTGVDSKHLSPALFKRVKEVVNKLKNNLARVIQEGIDSGEFRKDVDADLFAGRIYSIIQGSIFLTTTLDDYTYLVDSMENLELVIDNELKTKQP